MNLTVCSTRKSVDYLKKSGYNGTVNISSELAFTRQPEYIYSFSSYESGNTVLKYYYQSKVP